MTLPKPVPALVTIQFTSATYYPVTTSVVEQVAKAQDAAIEAYQPS